MLPAWFTYVFIMSTVRTFLSLCWLRLNRWLSQSILTKDTPANGGHHKIVVIGDGLAEGFGDHVIAGRVAGITRFLRSRLAENELKHRWSVNNLGHYGSTSFDWRPDCVTKPACMKYGVRQTLWRDLQTNKNFVDAEIVVLLVGGMDRMWAPTKEDALDPEATVRNIEAICDRLNEMGKTVSVSLLAGTASGLAEADKKRNFLLLKLLNRKARELTDAKKSNGGRHVAGVVGGAQLCDMVGSPPDPEAYAADGFHVCHPVYRLAAQRIFQELFTEVMGIEGEAVRGMFSFGGNSSSSAANVEAKPEADKKAD